MMSLRDRGNWSKYVMFGDWTYFVAIPEHLANVFRATRSPRRILRMGPRTVAQCLTGSKDSPSRICHATLYVYLQRRGDCGDPRRKEANVRVLGEEGGEETHTCNPIAGRLRRKREHRPPCPRYQIPMSDRRILQYRCRIIK